MILYSNEDKTLHNVPQNTPERPPMPIKKNNKVTNRPLTRKQEAFVKHLVENPKASATQAVLSTYNIDNPKTASVVAAQNLVKPSIVTELAKYNNLVENTLINTVNEYSQSDKQWERSLAVDTSKYIHDKIHGKATQRIEQQTTGVTLTIDLTSALETDQA
jgi:hypothetical protein